MGKPTKGKNKWIDVYKCVTEDVSSQIGVGTPEEFTVTQEVISNIALFTRVKVNNLDVTVASVDGVAKIVTLDAAPVAGDKVVILYPITQHRNIHIQTSFEWSLDQSTEELPELGTDEVQKEVTEKTGEFTFELTEESDEAITLFNEIYSDEIPTLITVRKIYAGTSYRILRSCEIRTISNPVSAGGVATESIGGDFIPPIRLAPADETAPDKLLADDFEVIAYDTSAPGAILIDWGAYVPPADIDEYHVYKRNSADGGAFTSIDDANVTRIAIARDTEVLDKSLAAETYFYAIVAVDVNKNKVTSGLVSESDTVV